MHVFSFDALSLADKIIVDSRKVDYIIVGQGIAGSWLSYVLIKRGFQIAVFNHETEDMASLKAAGLYNPITGRKMTKTWLADHIFPPLETSYRELEIFLGETFLHKKSVYRPFLTVEEQNDWSAKIEDSTYADFVANYTSSSAGYPGVQDGLGGIVIQQAGYVNLPQLIKSFRTFLVSKGVYHPELFDYQRMEVGSSEVTYKNLLAKKVIFCEGPSMTNPFWKELPFKLVRGELMNIACGLESDVIINRGVFMIPKPGHFTVGSTYDHEKLSFEPQKEGILSLKKRLGKLFAGPYRVIEKKAGIRPATFDRKPFIGIHKNHQTLAIFNGFGTKGVSLTPYFANQFVDHLEGKSRIEKEADVKRVY